MWERRIRGFEARERGAGRQLSTHYEPQPAHSSDQPNRPFDIEAIMDNNMENDSTHSVVDRSVSVPVPLVAGAGVYFNVCDQQSALVSLASFLVGSWSGKAVSS